MPDIQLNIDQILSVIEYIKETDRATPATANSNPNDSIALGSIEPKVQNDSLDMQYTPESISGGRDLFNGYREGIQY